MPKKKITPSNSITNEEGTTVEKPVTEPKKGTRGATTGKATLKKASLAKSESAPVAQPATKPQKRTMSKSTEAQASEIDLSRYHEEIAVLAYHLWEESGYQHGNHEENWYRAQEEIRRRYSQTKTMTAGAGSR
ncbi:MAG: DUF2934 domain-containing protein [Bryobacterales bacterium]|nr:DUF2934 domain-containing protein [Bryobacterales bacterium]